MTGYLNPDFRFEFRAQIQLKREQFPLIADKKLFLIFQCNFVVKDNVN